MIQVESYDILMEHHNQQASEIIENMQGTSDSFISPGLIAGVVVGLVLIFLPVERLVLKRIKFKKDD